MGQHFLRKSSVVEAMIRKTLGATTGAVVLEIGCGDGFLTEKILAKTTCKKLVCLELDQNWANFVSKKVQDPRLLVLNVNALEACWSELSPGEPMVLLANLPYNISIPIVKKLRHYAALFAEGVFMVQEEVAQKFVAKTGRNFGSISVFLQHVFDFQLMEKIGPEAFSPPPNVDSRLVYFKPKARKPLIDDEENFWKFVRLCFTAPRQMLKNNLKGHSFDLKIIEQKVSGLRAQQINFEQFLDLWNSLRT